MIEIKGIHKTFDDKLLFSDFDLKIDSADFVVLAGPSGCGKTTLLNIIGALETVDKGEVTVDGIDITNKKNHLNYFRTKIGFLFQNFALIDHKTVEQNLEMIQKQYRSHLTIEEALSRVGLKDKIKKKVFTLSGGEQQRVALARLMLKKCDLILADEPTGSLDQKNAQLVIEILKNLNKEGKTIVLVTHDETIKQKGKRLVNL
jgi:putative ABC transport system ATP-binding protein